VRGAYSSQKQPPPRAYTLSPRMTYSPSISCSTPFCGNQETTIVSAERGRLLGRQRQQTATGRRAARCSGAKRYC
jgi:hypothetical protein